MKLQVIDSLVIKNNYFLSGVFWLLNQILGPLSQTILSITLFWFIWSKKIKKTFPRVIVDELKFNLLKCDSSILCYRNTWDLD